MAQYRCAVNPKVDISPDAGRRQVIINFERSSLCLTADEAARLAWNLADAVTTLRAADGTVEPVELCG